MCVCPRALRYREEESYPSYAADGTSLNSGLYRLGGGAWNRNCKVEGERNGGHEWPLFEQKFVVYPFEFCTKMLSSPFC